MQDIANPRNHNDVCFFISIDRTQLEKSTFFNKSNYQKMFPENETKRMERKELCKLKFIPQKKLSRYARQTLALHGSQKVSQFCYGEKGLCRVNLGDELSKSFILLKEFLLSKSATVIRYYQWEGEGTLRVCEETFVTYLAFFP